MIVIIQFPTTSSAYNGLLTHGWGNNEDDGGEHDGIDDNEIRLLVKESNYGKP